MSPNAQRTWSQHDIDAWWDQDHSHAATHEILYQPTFRVRVARPPWLSDSEWDDEVALTTQAWDASLCQADRIEIWAPVEMGAVEILEREGAGSTVHVMPLEARA